MADPQQQDNYMKRKPSNSNVLVLAALVPFGVSLLILVGLTLSATVISLTVVTPLFVIFSPVLLPAALFIALAVAGFLTSGVFGITSISSFAWLATNLRRSHSPEHPQRPRDDADRVAQKTDEAVRQAQETDHQAQKETATKAHTDISETRKAHKESVATS